MSHDTIEKILNVVHQRWRKILIGFITRTIKYVIDLYNTQNGISEKWLNVTSS